MRWKSHVRFGRRSAETDRSKDRHRAADRPHTKLRGPSKGVFYHLYVLIDIFSRYNPGWLVSTCEESNLAADFIADAITRNSRRPTQCPRRPRNLDDVQAGIDAAHRPRRHPVPFSPARIQRQPVLARRSTGL